MIRTIAAATAAAAILAAGSAFACEGMKTASGISTGPLTAEAPMTPVPTAPATTTTKTGG